MTFQRLAFLGIFLGFAIKVPMWPFHTWLPDAHTEAPTVGSVLLAGILLKMGTYGFIRIAIPILPDAAVEFAPIIAVLAVIAIIYGALCCLAQTDLKRLIAFSSVGHMGFVMLGIATLTPSGVNAAIFGMVAHGVITGMLFFVVGSMKERYHTRAIADIGGGLLQTMPRWGRLTYVAIASLGLPGLAGFWGEIFALLAAFNPAQGIVDAGFLTLFRVLGGPRRRRHRADRRLLPVHAPAREHGQRPAAGGRTPSSRTSPCSSGAPGRRCSCSPPPRRPALPRLRHHRRRRHLDPDGLRLLAPRRTRPPRESP
jgi:formate hydrogenlyase subunit 3/multisubunit Na+/H+ antiporter MnhD subunit